MSVAVRRSEEPGRFEDYMYRMEEMMEDPAFAYALDTIEGIHDWCENTGVITDRQIQSIENIMNGSYSR